MSKVKSSPAVITTFVLFLMAMLVPALPAQATASGTSPIETATDLASKGTSLNEQLAHLTKKVRLGHRGPAVIKTVVRANRRVIHLNRSLASLSSSYLNVEPCDAASLNRLIAGNSAGVRLTKAALMLDRYARSRSTRKVSRVVSETAM